MWSDNPLSGPFRYFMVLIDASHDGLMCLFYYHRTMILPKLLCKLPNSNSNILNIKSNPLGWTMLLNFPPVPSMIIVWP